MTKINKNRLIVECSCNNLDQLLVFDYYKDLNGNNFHDEVNVSFTSRYYKSFWKRIIIGFKYIFKGTRFMTSDCVSFTHDNITELENICLFLKKIKKVKKIK